MLQVQNLNDALTYRGFGAVNPTFP